jgi:hypothetical protein
VFVRDPGVEALIAQVMPNVEPEPLAHARRLQGLEA